MGGKLTKTKTTTATITEGTIEQEKILPVSTSKTTTKKKKEDKSKINASKSKVDQSTNTDHYLLITSSGQEHLVGNQPSSLSAAAAATILQSEQINSAYQFESIHDDAEQLRQTCIRNGIVTDGEFEEPTNSSVMIVENEVKIQQHGTEHSSMTE